MRYKASYFISFVAGFSLCAALFLMILPSVPCWYTEENVSSKMCKEQTVSEVSPPLMVEDIGGGFVRREMLGPAGSIVVEELKKEEAIQKVYEVCPFAEIPPPYKQNQRYKKLEHELASVDPLYVGIIADDVVFFDRCRAILRTWGSSLDISCFSVHASRSFRPPEDIPVVTIRNFNGGNRVFTLLKYMFETLLSKYDFFLLSHDSTYVKADNLVELLRGVNPLQVVYMGAPMSGKTKNGTVFRYCFAKSGIVLSRAALAKLGKMLDECQKSADRTVLEGSGDQVLGECMLVHLHTQCTWSEEVTELFLVDEMNLSLKGNDIYNAPKVKSALSLHPVTDVDHMYRLHMYIAELSLMDRVERTRQKMKDYLALRKHVPPHALRDPNAKWPIFPKIGVSSPQDLPIWEYFNSSDVCTLHHQQPIKLLSKSDKMATQRVMDLVLAELHANTSLHFMKRYTVYNGFRNVNPSVGTEFVFRVGLTDFSSQKVIQFVVDSLIPLGLPAQVKLKPWLQPWNTIHVHLIIPLSKSEFIFVEHFLTMYRDECIKQGFAVTLHFVMCSNSDESVKVLSNKVEQLLHNFPSTRVHLHTENNTDCTIALAYKKVAYQLHVDELMIFMRVQKVFHADFLFTSLLMSRRGEQVFAPVAFWEIHEHQPSFHSVGRESGNWGWEDFDVLVIYVQDFDNLGQVNSMEEVWNKLLRHPSLSVVRALDPFLFQNRTLE